MDEDGDVIDILVQRSRNARAAIDWRRNPHDHGPELVRGAEAPGAQLTRQIPWLRVFVEGVVIVIPVSEYTTNVHKPKRPPEPQARKAV